MILRFSKNGPAIVIANPSSRAYYSERNGINKPILKIGGWRLFWVPV